MPNKKKDKQFFSLAGIDWSDDASIDAGAAAMWGVINAQLSSEMKPTTELTGLRNPKAVAYANWGLRNAQRREEMNNKKIEVKEPTIELTGKYTQAVAYANRHHKKQRRKGKDVPYISHLLAVSALVLEAGGDQDQAIGGLLHDVAEDCGGEERLAEIKERFGERVEAIVRGCSDSITSDPKQKADWDVRKPEYLKHLASASPDVLIVSAADKLHNSRDTLADINRDGITTLDRFNGKAEGTIAYYTALWVTLSEAGAPILLTTPLHDIAQHMVNALYPTKGYDIDEPATQREITKSLLGV